MATVKVDVEAKSSSEHAWKVGEKLQVHCDGEQLICTAVDGIKALTVIRPADGPLQHCREGCQAVIRSVRRPANEDTVVHITVRIFPQTPYEPAGTPAHAAAASRPVLTEEDEEEGLKLSDAALQAVVGNEGIRQHLHNTQLQEVVRMVDAAPDRERALHQALGNPHFAAFCSEVLDIAEAPSAATLHQQAHADAEQKVSDLLHQLTQDPV